MSLRSDLKAVIDYWRELHRKNAAEGVRRPPPQEPTRSFALALIGVRRCGKTFLAAQIPAATENVFPLNFEDPFFIAHDDPVILDEALSVHVEYYGDPDVMIFDEIHNIKNWERWLRKRIDAKNHKIVVTGSSAKMLSSEIATSLTGRCLKFPVWPLSFNEFLDFTKRHPDTPDGYLNALRVFTETGGFPEVVLTRNEGARRQILRQYLSDILYKDVIKRRSVRSANALEMIANHYLANVSCHHSANKTAKAFGLNVETAADYTAFLEEAFLFFSVPRYHRNLKVQARDTRKIYVIDTGMRNAHVVRHSEDRGKLAENIVFLELKRRGRDVYYFKDGGETDFVVVESGRPVAAVQVCADDMSDPKTEAREMDSLRECLEAVKLDQGLILTLKREETVRAKGKVLKLTPLFKWLSGRTY